MLASHQNSSRPRPMTLIILDGWGAREEKQDNAIAAAYKPNWEHFLNTYPHTIISGSGRCVGLPDGQMGNSEVGHLNMGAGRIIQQDLTRIDSAIESGAFFSNTVLKQALLLAKQKQTKVHILGLLSPGGVHSREQHIHALIQLAAQLQLPNIYIHAFLDGRDCPPRSAMASLLGLDAVCKQQQCGQIASIIGRYYAMDRDQRWDRIQKAYDLLVSGQASYHAQTAEQALTLAYARGENDEFVQPTSILPVTLDEGDVVIFMNFRADRARELTQALTDPEFQGFDRKKRTLPAAFVCLTEYDDRFPLPVAFPPSPSKNILAEVLSRQGLKQLRIAETEKYAHVTFFFNGGVEQPYPGETRLLIKSPAVATYDLLPEMSAPEITENLLQAIRSGEYDFILCNFANPDMVGHTGCFEPTVKAIETIDVCLGKLIPAIQAAGGEIIITADHGNAERMFDPATGQPHTAHTIDPVPFIYIGRKASIIKQDGKLSDIAPTLLYLMDIPQPSEMTGEKLVELK